MSKDELCSELKTHFQKCDELKGKINHLSAVQVSSKSLRDEIELVSSEWFTLSKQIKPYFTDYVKLEKYNSAFKALLKLCGKTNRTSSFITQFEIICKDYRSEIIVFMQTDAEEKEETTNATGFDAEVKILLDKIADKDENTYLLEALGCWKQDYRKASMVLLWCAAIDRIHRAIEKIGFEKFNNTSEEMKAQTNGRYKKFNKNQNVLSLSDLRNVPDGDVLWIIEGMGLIDSNQKARLTSCFEMRCHAGHPGDAPITKYNIISCFSDIVEIVLANPIFEIKEVTTMEKDDG